MSMDYSEFQGELERIRNMQEELSKEGESQAKGFKFLMVLALAFGLIVCMMNIALMVYGLIYLLQYC